MEDRVCRAHTVGRPRLLHCGWCLTAMEVEEEEEEEEDEEEVIVMLCAVQSSRRNATSRST